MQILSLKLKLLFAFCAGFIIGACGGQASSPPTTINKDLRKLTISSFFSEIDTARSAGSGLWQADVGDFDRFIQDNFISKYQPKPKENSKTVTQSLLKDSALFFRIEGTEIGRLFVIKGYNLSVSAGDLRIIDQKNQNEKFTMILNKKTSNAGITSEISQMMYNPRIDSWIWIIKNRQIKLSRVKREPQSLAKEYSDSFSTSLQSY